MTTPMVAERGHSPAAFGEPVCAEREPRRRIMVCTRELGHADEHAAHGWLGTGAAVELARWPNTDLQRMDDESPSTGTEGA